MGGIEMLTNPIGPCAVQMFGVTITTAGFLRAYRYAYRLIQDDGTLAPAQLITIFYHKKGWR